ncbi:hypothetical protein UlMin_034281 [Ulmus minor]
MELRSCNHLHFIQTVQGGLVIKKLNVYRGKPVLKFKKLNEIYEASGTENENPSHASKVKRLLFKSESPAGENSDGDDGRNSDVDGLVFGSTTLKQIKEKCKEKKRKRSKFVDLTAAEMCTRVKEETDEDDSDLMEPLSNLKSKLSKNKKAKRKCLKNHVSTPAKGVQETVNSEEISGHQDIIPSKEDLSAPINIKVEVPHPGFSDSQSAVRFDGDSSTCNDGQVDSLGIISKDVAEIAIQCFPTTQVPISPTLPELFIVNEVSQERVGAANSEPIQIVSEPGNDMKKVDEIGTECVPPTQVLISPTESQFCSLNKAHHEYIGDADSELVQILNADIKEVEISEVTCHNSDLPASESKEEGYDNDFDSTDIFFEPVFSPCDRSSDMHDDSQSPWSEYGMPSKDGSDTADESSDVAVQSSLQHTEFGQGSDLCAPDDIAEEDLSSSQETSALHSSVSPCNLASDSCLVSSPDSPTAEENQPQRTTCGDKERNCSPEMLHNDASEELTTSDGSECHHNPNLKRPPPERLLSTRKSISPDSQEKLCEAMKSVELQDEEAYSHKKLCFGKQTRNENKIHGAERSDQISNHQQINVEPKNHKRNVHLDGISKVPPLSHAVPGMSTGCTSIESCSQNAVAFSERQMRDIECLATKLTNELKTMKEIAEESLYPETFSARSLKYKAHEVRLAVKSANKVEQLAKRWLSMMARDCNRFCKIMKLTEKQPDDSQSAPVSNKGKKKITFADEAGEELCHVRLFENNLSSTPETDTEKPQVLN